MRHLLSTVTLAASLTALAALPDPAIAEETTPPWSQADAYWGKDVMAKSRQAVQMANGAMNNLFLMADRIERQIGDEENLVWDLQGWYGGDIDKLWIKSEGDYQISNKVEDAEVQALWSHAVSPYWDVQAGLRVDIEPDTRAHAVIGAQGLAPQWFEVDAAAFLSDEGDLTGRIEVEYDLLLNQQLILQPRGELEWTAQDIADREIKSGFTKLNLGARLRYEFVREFAPYMGWEWQRNLGGTGRLVEAAGDKNSKTVFVLGVRAWF